MAVPLLRSSRFFRSLVLTTWVFSVLLWLYIVARIIVNQVDVHMPFVDSVPSLSFSAMGAFAFGLSFLSMFIYLWPWLENTGPSDAQREPGMPRGAKVNTAPHIRDLTRWMACGFPSASFAASSRSRTRRAASR